MPDATNRTTGSKPMKAYDLGALKAKAEAKGFDLNWEGEPILHVPPPELWPDEAHLVAKSGGSVAAARVIFGEDAYANFVEVTGLGAEIIFAAAKDHFGSDVGES